MASKHNKTGVQPTTPKPTDTNNDKIEESDLQQSDDNIIHQNDKPTDSNKNKNKINYNSKSININIQKSSRDNHNQTKDINKNDTNNLDTNNININDNALLTQTMTQSSGITIDDEDDDIITIPKLKSKPKKKLKKHEFNVLKNTIGNLKQQQEITADNIQKLQMNINNKIKTVEQIENKMDKILNIINQSLNKTSDTNITSQNDTNSYTSILQNKNHNKRIRFQDEICNNNLNNQNSNNSNSNNHNLHNHNQNFRRNKNNDKQETDDINSPTNDTNNNEDDISLHSTDFNDTEIIQFVSKIKNFIATAFNLDTNNIYDHQTFDETARNLALEPTIYDKQNNVTNILHHVEKVPEQLLSPLLYEADDTNDMVIEYNNINKVQEQRKNAMENTDATMQRASNFLKSNDLQSHILKNVIDPKANAHELDKVNRFNEQLAELLQINENGTIELKECYDDSLPLSNIAMINENKLEAIYNEIESILKYNKTDDDKLPVDKQVKNGRYVRYTNIPTLDANNYHNINITIGNPANRKLFHPNNPENIIKFGILCTITDNLLKKQTHWDMINMIWDAEKYLHSPRDFALELIKELLELPEIDKIRTSSKQTQQILASQLATKICNNRFIPTNAKNKNKKDKFWIKPKIYWKFWSTLNHMIRELFRAIESLKSSIFKYASGRTLISRSNWNQKSFQIIGDTDGKCKQTLCADSNKLKTAYEKKLSEKIISAKFIKAIEIKKNIDEYIHNSSDLEAFCYALHNKDIIEYTENILALYKKAEMNMISAEYSTSKFRFDLMNTKRDLISLMTILKYSKNINARDIIKSIQNDVHILNIITHGEIRTANERLNKIKDRLSARFVGYNEIDAINFDNMKNVPISDVMNMLFENTLFTSDNNMKNHFRIKEIKRLISQFEKEDNNYNKDVGFQSTKIRSNKRNRQSMEGSTDNYASYNNKNQRRKPGINNFKFRKLNNNHNHNSNRNTNSYRNHNIQFRNNNNNNHNNPYNNNRFINNNSNISNQRYNNFDDNNSYKNVNFHHHTHSPKRYQY